MRFINLTGAKITIFCDLGKWEIPPDDIKIESVIPTPEGLPIYQLVLPLPIPTNDIAFIVNENLAKHFAGRRDVFYPVWEDVLTSKGPGKAITKLMRIA